MVVRMAGYENVPAHGIPEFAKCDQPNGDVGGDRKGRVIGLEQKMQH